MQLLDKFTDELHTWSLNEKEPSCASRDLHYYLNQQEKRLKQTGTVREEDFKHVKEEIRGCSFRKGNGYSSRLLYREAVQHITYRKNGKQLKHIQRPVNLYVNIVDKEGHEDRNITCPNCGHTITALAARDGCPYCGTFFEVDDIYPCVASYYTVPTVVERTKLTNDLKKELIISGCVCGILIAMVSFFSWDEMELPFRILASLFFGAFYGGAGAFLWYVVRSLLLLVKMFYEAGRSVPLLKTLRSRKKMMAFMEANDPDFSYEAFEGRVISLLRTIIFSEDRETLSIYEGGRNLSAFDQLVDMQYRGGVYIQKFEKKGNMLHVEGTAYLTDTYIRSFVREKDEKFRFILEKEADVRTDPGFSIMSVNCLSCGGSFDATRRSNCPYCGTPYDPKKKDWIMKDLWKA